MKLTTRITSALILILTISNSYALKTKRVDPIELFHQWYQQAVNTRILIPEAAVLSTTVRNPNRVKARVIIVRRVTKDGFLFFTTPHSNQTKEMSKHPLVSLLFYWPISNNNVRQVILTGTVKKTKPSLTFKTPTGKRGVWQAYNIKPDYIQFSNLNLNKKNTTIFYKHFQLNKRKQWIFSHSQYSMPQFVTKNDDICLRSLSCPLKSH